jgi:hypothetical protein
MVSSGFFINIIVTAATWLWDISWGVKVVGAPSGVDCLEIPEASTSMPVMG